MNDQRVLIACIGNIFLGDDGFGCEVARQLACTAPWPGVRLVDFGIRACDLAFTLAEPWELVILVDATQRGGTPGTLYVIEPDLAAATAGGSAAGLPLHSIDPVAALQMAGALGSRPKRLLLVGCEPVDFGPDDEGRLGLSPAVLDAATRTPELLRQLVERHQSCSPAGLAAESTAPTEVEWSLPGAVGRYFPGCKETSQ